MAEQTINVLIVEDDPNHVVLIQALILETDAEGVNIGLASAHDDALEGITSGRYDVCLLDYKLDDTDGLTLLHHLKETDNSTPIVFLTSMGNEDIAVEAMKAGASDYLRKENLSGDLLWASMRYAMELQRHEERRKQAESALWEAKEELELRVEERTSALRETNEELRTAYEALKEADRLKTEMIQNVSHEFRTPLGYVVGYVGLIREDLQNTGDLGEAEREKLQDYMSTVSRATQRLTRLIENFTAIQSLDSRELHLEPASAASLIAEAMEGAVIKAEDLEITLSTELEADLPPVMVDTMAINQVLDNLIANAFKFTDANGEVTVRAWTNPEDAKVTISVTDNGVGIPSELHERIFERFYQVDGSPTREYGGVGLGLAVCKEIVEAHGETIWVESGPDRGTTLAFTLPIAR